MLNLCAISQICTDPCGPSQQANMLNAFDFPPKPSRCEHYFCETCALTNYKKSKRCFVCGKQTFGVFNPAKKLIDRLKLEDEQRRGRTADADSDEEVFREVSQGPAAPQAGGSSQNEEQPVTEIELIHYDSKAPAIDDDSDDSGDSD